MGFEIFNLFLMMAFCLISGYMLGFCLRIIALLEKIQEHLAKIDNEPQSLPAGMYALGATDPRTGQTPLVPMQSHPIPQRK